ncbi:hypothetical protein VP14_081 [Vibrio phage VPMCC14]|nr:hypothetical protein VP14_081 [Vibrio phage VPMCC14]
MSKWVKVESDFLSEALMRSLVENGNECSGKTPTSTKGIVHSFKQVNKHEMVVCWECKDYWGDIQMGNCKIKTNWWEDE